MRRSLISVLSAAGLLSFAASASAAVITLNASEQGWIAQNNDSNGTTSTNNYIVGNCGANDCREGEFRNFFGFSIPTLGGSIVSVNLVINTALGIFQQSPSLTVQFTSLGSTNSFAALGTGTFYGSFTYGPSDSFQTESIALGAAALTDIASSQGGTFLLGGRDVSATQFGATSPDQFVFGSSGGAQQLVITTTGQAVPEPGSLGLLGAASLGFWIVRRSRSSRGRPVRR